MKRWMIVIAKNYTGEEYEFPDVYPVSGDSAERAAAILEMIYRKYLAAEERESAIPIDHEHTYCRAEEGYAQITWENGDIHRYFLTTGQEIPEFEDEEEKDSGDARCRNANPAGTEEGEDENIPWSGQVLSLSTVHVMPDAVDLLATPMSSDMLQIFPNHDSCMMHITDVDNALGYDLPLCIKDCIRYARKHGCQWIYFGYEGKKQEGLPTYRFAWDKVL